MKTTTIRKNMNESNNDDNAAWIMDLKDNVDKATQSSTHARLWSHNSNSKVNNDSDEVARALHPDTSRNELHETWLHDAKSDAFANYKNVAIDEFLDECLSNDDIVKGCMPHDFLNQLEVAPNVTALEGSLDDMPLQDDHVNAHVKDATSTSPLLFDVVIEWED